jgi:hypothetical protein
MSPNKPYQGFFWQTDESQIRYGGNASTPMENGILLHYFSKIPDYIQNRPVKLAGRKQPLF